MVSPRLSCFSVGPALLPRAPGTEMLLHNPVLPLGSLGHGLTWVAALPSVAARSKVLQHLSS